MNQEAQQQAEPSKNGSVASGDNKLFTIGGSQADAARQPPHSLDKYLTSPSFVPGVGSRW